MNTYEKNVALAKKEHPEIWYEYAADSAGVVIKLDDDEDGNEKVVELEILVQAPFEKGSTFGTIYFTNNSPFNTDWEEDQEIELADLSKDQIKKAKEIWKNL